jgi:HAD superfamily hydrolase (TIGR01458 family)
MRPRAVLVDVDGTLIAAGAAVAGAAAALAELRRSGLRLLVATNISRWPRSTIVRRLGELGITIELGECLSATSAAADWLRAAGAERIAPLVPEATLEEFTGLTIDFERPDHVLVGDLGPAWSFEHLNRAFLSLRRGARLIAIHRNPYWHSDNGPALDAGAFVAALEYAAGLEATLIGKPAASFFHGAARLVGCAPADVLMIGDDLDNDVRGALAAGLRAIRVRSGKPAALPPEAADPAEATLDSIADLPGYLQCL